jgi:cytochrome c556
MLRGSLIAVAGAALVVVTISAQSNDKPSEAFIKAMRDNADATRAIRVASKEFEESGAGAQDFDPFEKAAATMKASFSATLTYWQAQKVDGAIALNEQALKHVAALATGAKERDYRLVLEASTALNETCGSCHTSHRVRTDDGAYEIKIK